MLNRGDCALVFTVSSSADEVANQLAPKDLASKSTPIQHAKWKFLNQGVCSGFEQGL